MMFKKLLILMAILSIFSTCTVQAAVIDSNWVGGSQGQWGEASNWDSSVVPDNDGDTFNVTIDSAYNGVDEVEVGLNQNHTIEQLDCFGNVRLESWTSGYLADLVINEGLINHGDLAIEIDIWGNVTNTVGAELDVWGHINIFGNLYNQAGAKIWFSHVDTDIEDGGIIENDGLIICTEGGGPGEMPMFENRGSILLFEGGCSSEEIFDNNSTGTIKGSGRITGHDLIHNSGVITASSGALLLVTEGSVINTGILENEPGATLHIIDFPGTSSSLADVNNKGTIEVNADGSVILDCNLANEPNGTVKLRGGTLASPQITQVAGADFNGFGTIKGNLIIEPNSPAEPNSVVTITGPTTIIGDVNIPAGATLEISDGQTLITGHTVCDGTIHLIGGTVVFQDGCDCEDCNIIHEAGADRLLFDVNADGIENFEDFSEFADNWLWQASWY